MSKPDDITSDVRSEVKTWLAFQDAFARAVISERLRSEAAAARVAGLSTPTPSAKENDHV